MSYLSRPSRPVGPAHPRAGRRAGLLLATVLALVTGGLTGPVSAGAEPAGPCAAPVQNRVACENTQQGSTDWSVAPSTTIEGFGSDASVNVGQRIDFRVRTDSTAYRVDVYRLGYYGGSGGRLITSLTPSVALPQVQPDCDREPSSGLVDCGNWAVSASWNVPADAVSGVYVANLHRLDTTAENQITFVVRDDSSRSDVVVQTSDTTWAAYNQWGGANLYSGNGPGPSGRAYKVSYNRPLGNEVVTGRLMYAEYPMLRWLERNGYDVSYVSGVDTDRSGASLLPRHRLFLSVGHDEYWSGRQRDNVEAARDAGVNLGFFSGNEMWWRTRWESSLGTDPTAYRTLVTYKDTLTNGPTDPTGEWTGTWRDPRFRAADQVEPENALIGQQFRVNGANGRRTDALSVPAAYGRMRLWRGTDVARQAAGATYTFGAGTLGYEWDADDDNGARPAGLAHLSETTVDVADNDVLQDYGSTYAPGRVTHNLSLYRAPSGALVFAAGTVQWSWGLDDTHDGAGQVANTPMRQATVNLFADMGIQPATRQLDLAAASASQDNTPPTVVINSPAAGGGGAVGQPLTVAGTATDAAGVVAGVEVSVDGGTSWHPAAGREAWSYTFTPSRSGPVTVQARAVDDSALLSAPVSRPVSVGARTCPCSVWPDTTQPAVASVTDTAALEAGLKFRTTTAGYVTGVRFYKGPANTGTHTGSLWSATGQRLATGTFTNETGSGWQRLVFPAAVAVTANTTYVASYFAPAGGYATTAGYFTGTGVLNEPLNALQAGVDGGNGVFNSGAPGFPTRTYQGANYWVDPVFVVDPPPDVTPPNAGSVTPADGSSSVPPGTTVSTVFDEAVQAGSVVLGVSPAAGGAAVPGTTRYDAATRTATWTPTSPLARATRYTATLGDAVDASGNHLAGPVTWSFTTQKPAAVAGTCPCSVWDDTAQPATASSTDTRSVELGLRFTSDTNGTVTGVRYYRGADNTGTHVGSLWSASGQLLAQVTFTGESTAGWQTASFTQPVTVVAGTTYVVSYHANAGGYALTRNGLASAVVNAPLTAAATTTTAANGVYAYGATSAFPTAGNGTNYWVDVVFTPAVDTSAPAVTRTAPSNGATSVPVGTAVTATFSKPVTGGTLTITPGTGGPVAGSSSYDPGTRTLTVRPSAPLAAGTVHTARVTGARDSAGLVMDPFSWSFTTAGAGACPCTLFGEAVPGTPSVTDSRAVELGMAFTTDTAGWIAGARFYKGAGNTGTHTASLWTVGGERLATGTFVNETASGWQQLSFDNPVAVTAGTTYVVSYFAPVGRYAADPDFFATARDNAPLHGAADATTRNGLFTYGSSAFPTSSYRASNYWVDPVFTTVAPPDSMPPQVVSTVPGSGYTSVPTSSSVVVTFNESVQVATVRFTVTTAGGSTVTGSVAASGTRGVSFTPAQPLPAATRIDVTVSGAADTAGNVMVGSTATSFTTATASSTGCPCTLFGDSATPAVPRAADTAAIEVGLRFTSDTAGFVSGVRFYKGAGNSGTHSAHLWSNTGQLLATASFTDESTAGWQQVSFPQPVPVSAGTSYVVSYHMDGGGYAYTKSAFGTRGVDRPPLHAAKSSTTAPTGLYSYGPVAFPTKGGDTNYWVDVIFTP